MSHSSVKRRLRLLAATAIALSIGLHAAPSFAAPPGLDSDIDALLAATGRLSFPRISTVKIPGKPIVSFDFGFVDPVLPVYYFADRTNGGVDLIDTGTNSFVTRIAGFSGAPLNPDGSPNNAQSGPNSVQPTTPGEIWATNGDSTVKVVDLFQHKIIDSISTVLPGQTALQDLRTDGLSWDKEDQIMMIQNGDSEPPFVTFISTNPSDRRVLGHIVFTAATDIEASVYDRGTGMFYLNIAQIGTDPNAGALSVINPRTLSEVKEYPFTGCNAAGIALAPGQKLLIGCSLNNYTPIVNARDGSVIASIPQVGGADQVAYANGFFYDAARTNSAANGGASLSVIDAITNKFVVNVPSNVSAHVVSADPRTTHIFVPTAAIPGDPDCATSCIEVFAPKLDGFRHPFPLEALLADTLGK